MRMFPFLLYIAIVLTAVIGFGLYGTPLQAVIAEASGPIVAAALSCYYMIKGRI